MAAKTQAKKTEVKEETVDVKNDKKDFLKTQKEFLELGKEYFKRNTELTKEYCGKVKEILPEVECPKFMKDLKLDEKLKVSEKKKEEIKTFNSNLVNKIKEKDVVLKAIEKLAH